jgi:hypothetical protein
MKDIEIASAKRWATALSKEQFRQVTGLSDYPEYLAKDVRNDSLYVYANGEITYRLKEKCVKVKVTWNYAAPEGAGDTHYSIMRGTISNLVIRQGAEQNYKPALYIEPHTLDAAFETALIRDFASVQAKYPGIELKKNKTGWEVQIPDKYRNGHEAHFGQVTERYLQYLSDGKLPDWEVPNMLAKYYTTTLALVIASNRTE